MIVADPIMEGNATAITGWQANGPMRQQSQTACSTDHSSDFQRRLTGPTEQHRRSPCVLHRMTGADLEWQWPSTAVETCSTRQEATHFSKYTSCRITKLDDYAIVAIILSSRTCCLA